MDFPSLPIDLELLERPIERDLVEGLEGFKGLEPSVSKHDKDTDGIVEPKSLGGVGSGALWIISGLIVVVFLVALIRSRAK